MKSAACSATAPSGRTAGSAEEVLVRRGRVEVAVGEVAAPAAGDADLLGHRLGMVDEQQLAGRAGLACAKQTSGASADDAQNIVGRHSYAAR
jgi:hypothetical protein